MHLFDTDTALTDTGNCRFTGTVSGNWSVNGTPNGGYLMAMIASAMLARSDKRGMPLVTANYIGRCAPGPAEITVSEIGRSSQFTRFEGRLSQDGRERIRALGTFAADKNDCAIERYETGAARLAPYGDCVPMPRLRTYTLFDNLELRLDRSCAGWMAGTLSTVSENRGYFRFRDDRPIDLLSLFLIIDAMPPAVLATQGMTAWVPTIELSVNVRNLPLTKLLRCSLRTRFITCGLLEADGEVWDDDGNLAAISRQIAQLRKG